MNSHLSEREREREREREYSFKILYIIYNGQTSALIMCEYNEISKEKIKNIRQIPSF